MDAAPIKAVVFDFDGTLATLTLDFPLMKRKISALAEAYLGEPAPYDGLPALELVEDLGRRVQAAQGRDTALEFATRCRFAITEMELEAARRGGLFPNTRDLLGRLRVRGVKLGVFTRNCAAAIRIVFPDIDSHIDCVKTRNDVPRVKPHPDHLLAVLGCLGVAPDKGLTVGDHRLDIRCGRSAGTRTAGVAGGSLPLSELAAESPDYLAENCFTLMDELEARGLI